MRRAFFFSLTIGSAAMYVVFAGCGGDLGPVEPLPATASFCAAIAEPFCEAIHACCVNKGGADSSLRTFNSVDECKAYWSRPQCLWENMQSLLEASLAAGSTVFDQARFDACVARLKTLAAGETACVEPAGSILLNLCLGAFRGQIAEAEPCTWPDDSEVSFMQCKDGRCQQGTCSTFLKVGDACRTSKTYTVLPDELCNYPEGQWCRGDGETGTCLPQGELGDACVPDDYIAQCKSRNCDETTHGCIPATPRWFACTSF